VCQAAHPISTERRLPGRTFVSAKMPRKTLRGCGIEAGLCEDASTEVVAMPVVYRRSDCGERLLFVPGELTRYVSAFGGLL
jgi:hypothetical protein